MADARKGLVVYIVDDDESVRRGLSRVIRSAGLEPLAYGCGEHFLEEVRNHPAGCILLDITMPGQSGFQVAARLKERSIALPVIAVSARDDDETRRRAHELGAKLFFCKPVDDRALLDAIAWVAAARPSARS